MLRKKTKKCKLLITLNSIFIIGGQWNYEGGVKWRERWERRAEEDVGERITNTFC